jgi:glycosyltransferase involved in cell wall biosynthesis
MRTLLEAIFWLAAGLLIYSQIGYPLLLALLARPAPDAPQLDPEELPSATLIVAAYAEAAVIEAKVENALKLDYPRERLQVIVACDGSPDETPELARKAGADLVLELPHAGKMAAQNVAVEKATGELIAFSDANTMWDPQALRRLADALAPPDVSYACGRVSFVNESGDNQEGLYWRYEMWLRARESALASATAGNGAIYAVDPAAYKQIRPLTGHDLTLPFNVVKNGARAIDVAAAKASETMVPSISGEFRRKRRMMSFTWPIVLGGGMLNFRGFGAKYGWMIFSHRVLRYSAPFLHLAALLASAALAADSSTFLVLLALQLLLLAAAPLAKLLPLRPLLVARYYVLTTTAVALGLFDYLRKGTEKILDEGWTPPEGTR